MTFIQTKLGKALYGKGEKEGGRYVKIEKFTLAKGRIVAKFTPLLAPLVFLAFLLNPFSGNAQVFNTDTMCDPGGITTMMVDSLPNTNYYWNVSGASIVNGQGTHRIRVNWNGPGTYLVRVAAQNEDGCWGDTLNTLVYLKGKAGFNLKGPIIACIGDEVVLEVEGSGSFKWSTGDSTQFISFTALQDTTIYVVVEDDLCGNDTVFHHIIVYEKPVALLGSDKDSAFVFEDILFNGMTTSGTMEWYIDGSLVTSSSQVSYHFSTPGAKQVMLIARNGNCYDTTYKIVYIWEDFKVHIPRAFSPNGDGINDVFVFKGFGIARFEAYIFDRWGNMMYQWSDELENGWNGTIRGEDAMQDVYVYRIIVWDYRGRAREFFGDITLVR